ncbi:MAG: hypothetical protein HRU35_07880 [Rickettsiaceae bacterium]|nr:hypothetical protein [Rickettsiaceae bacterium]
MIFVFDFKHVFDKKVFTDICKSLIDNKPELANNYFFKRTIKEENIDLIAHIMKVNSENNNNPLLIINMKKAINFAIGNIVNSSLNSIEKIIEYSKDKLAVKDHWTELNYCFHHHNESSNKEDLDLSGADKNHYNDDLAPSGVVNDLD